MNKVVVVILIIVVACCCCLALIPIGGAAAYGIFSKLDSSANPFKTVETEVYIKPTLLFTPEAPLATMPAEAFCSPISVLIRPMRGCTQSNSRANFPIS